MTGERLVSARSRHRANTDADRRSTQLDPLDFALGESRLRVTSSGLIMSRLGQVSLTKPTYRRIVLRCCSVRQAEPSPDYEYRISLRPHPVGPSLFEHTGFCKQGGPASIRVRRDGY